jgi:hypothetical protein
VHVARGARRKPTDAGEHSSTRERHAASLALTWRGRPEADVGTHGHRRP